MSVRQRRRCHLDLLAAAALVIPQFNRRLTILGPIGAIFVAAEMLFFSGVHIASGAASMGPVIYWLAVAAIAAFVAFGRLVLKPMRRREFA